MTFDEYKDAVIEKAKQTYAGPFSLNAIREAFNSNDPVDRAAETVALESAWWNGDFPDGSTPS